MGSLKFGDFQEQESKRTHHPICSFVCYVTIRILFGFDGKDINNFGNKVFSASEIDKKDIKT